MLLKELENLFSYPLAFSHALLLEENIPVRILNPNFFYVFSDYIILTRLKVNKHIVIHMIISFDHRTIPKIPIYRFWEQYEYS